MSEVMNTLPRRRRVLEAAVANLGASRGPHLSIRGGRFRLVGVNGQETLMETLHVAIIIVDANEHSSRVYFGGRAFDPDSNEPPVCFSDNGVGPSTQAMQPQSPTCLVCPNNVRGSELTFTGKPTTACGNRKKLAFILPDDPSCTVYEMQIPPASLTNLKSYSDWIGSQGTSLIHGDTLDLADFITRVSFDPDKQFVLQFSANDWADNDPTLKLIEHIHANGLSDTAVGRNDTPCDPATVKGMIEAQAQGRALPAPAAPAQQALPPQAPTQLAPPPAVKAPRAPRAPRTQPQMAEDVNGNVVAPFAPVAQQQVSDDVIPTFLQRQPAPSVRNAPQMVQAAIDQGNGGASPRRFGIGNAPLPPAALSEALGKAMSLPTRR